MGLSYLRVLFERENQNIIYLHIIKVETATFKKGIVNNLIVFKYNLGQKHL